MKRCHLMSLCMEIKSKSIRDLNTEPETIQHVEENIGKTFLALVLAKIFLDMTPTAQASNPKNICNLYLSDKSLISKTDKDFKQSNSKKSPKLPKTKKTRKQNKTKRKLNRQRTRIDIFQENMYRWPTAMQKDAQRHSSIKPTLSYYLTHF